MDHLCDTAGRGGCVLFTAFEPSGDLLAAPVIETLRRQHPQLDIWAFGGSRMQEAGATLLDQTTDRPVMMGHAITEAWRHRQRLRRLRRFLAEHRVAALVPVDSPAANWSICKLIRRHAPAAKIVHLPAPQVWAWAGWRVARLRRLTDHVLCVLPFERDWFEQRGIRSTFIGHPIYNEQGDRAATDKRIDPPAPNGTFKLALLPGSRPGEVSANWPTMLETYRDLHTRHRDLVALVAAADSSIAQRITSLTRQLGETSAPSRNLDLRVGQTDAVLAWCDVALIVSGTATLQAAAHRTPMVALFKVSRLAWHLAGRWIVRTRPLTLPNLISEANGDGPVIPELVPHLGGAGPVTGALESLIVDAKARQRQIDLLDRVGQSFRGTQFAQAACRCLLAEIEAPRDAETGVGDQTGIGGNRTGAAGQQATPTTLPPTG